MGPEEPQESFTGKRPRPSSTRTWLRTGQTYHVLLGGDELGLFLQLGTEGIDMVLRLGSSFPLLLEPLVLLLELVGTERPVSQMSAATSVCPLSAGSAPTGKPWSGLHHKQGKGFPDLGSWLSNKTDYLPVWGHFQAVPEKSELNASPQIRVKALCQVWPPTEGQAGKLRPFKSHQIDVFRRKQKVTKIWLYITSVVRPER